MFHLYSRLSRLSENIGCFGHLVHSRNFTYHPVPFVTVILLIYYSWTASGTAVYKYQMPARDKADDALCSLGCHYVLKTCPLRLVWTSCGRNVPIDGVVRMNQMENKLPVTHCDSTIYVKFSSDIRILNLTTSFKLPQCSCHKSPATNNIWRQHTTINDYPNKSRIVPWWNTKIDWLHQVFRSRRTSPNCILLACIILCILSCVLKLNCIGLFMNRPALYLLPCVNIVKITNS